MHSAQNCNVENRNYFPKLSSFASWPGAMISPLWLERTNFHGPKDVRADCTSVEKKSLIWLSRCEDWFGLSLFINVWKNFICTIHWSALSLYALLKMSKMRASSPPDCADAQTDVALMSGIYLKPARTDPNLVYWSCDSHFKGLDLLLHLPGYGQIQQTTFWDIFLIFPGKFDMALRANYL